MTRATRLLMVVASVSVSGCFEDDAPIGPTDPVPNLEYVTVDASFGETGRTLVAWSHPDGPLAITDRPATMRFTVRTPTGQNVVETVTTPFDVRSPSPGIIELEYRWGRNLMEIRATQEDTAGRSSTYHCFAPDWNCYRQ